MRFRCDALIGTDGRASSFTRDFRPLHTFSRDRLRSAPGRVRRRRLPAHRDGASSVMAYFVIDGHHRAALARRGGAEMIDADVTELVARVPLAGRCGDARGRPPGARADLRRGQRACRGAARRALLGQPARPLPRVLENIQVHGYRMMRGRGRVLENTEIAADWYDSIYTPTLDAIERLRLGRLYRDAPPGDLFLVLHRLRRDAFPSMGCPHLAQTVVSVVGDGGRRRRMRWPARGARPPL